MKKRAMKKWIPKNTPYCYELIDTNSIDEFGMVVHTRWCPYYKQHEKYSEQFNEIYPVSFCKYCGCGDDALLDDQCKMCGISEGEYY